MSKSPKGEDRLTIWANSNVSRGKFAAAAVHTALNHYGIAHGAVIVLGAKPKDIKEICTDVVQDAGRTEVDPGTVTAGVYDHENDQRYARRSETLDAIRAALAADRKDAMAYGEWTVGDVMVVLKEFL